MHIENYNSKIHNELSNKNIYELKKFIGMFNELFNTDSELYKFSDEEANAISECLLNGEFNIINETKRRTGKTFDCKRLAILAMNHGFSVGILRPNKSLLKEYNDIKVYAKLYKLKLNLMYEMDHLIGKRFDLLIVDEVDQEIMKKMDEFKIYCNNLFIRYTEPVNDESLEPVNDELQNPNWNKIERKIDLLVDVLHSELGWFNEEELDNTPRRVMRFYKEWFENSQWNDFRLFENGDDRYGCEKYDELIILKDIEVASMCSHHILPFTGKCHIAYLPDEKVCGVSKLARVVKKFASRPQIQEQLTNDVANYIYDELKPRFVLVVMECQHMCMKIRGVKEHNSQMTTSAIRYKDDIDWKDLKIEAMKLFYK